MSLSQRRALTAYLLLLVPLTMIVWLLPVVSTAVACCGKSDGAPLFAEWVEYDRHLD